MSGVWVRFPVVAPYIPRSSNGRTAGFELVYVGSTPTLGIFVIPITPYILKCYEEKKKYSMEYPQREVVRIS